MFNLKKIGTSAASDAAGSAAGELAGQAGIENEAVTGAIGDTTGSLVENQLSGPATDQSASASQNLGA